MKDCTGVLSRAFQMLAIGLAYWITTTLAVPAWATEAGVRGVAIQPIGCGGRPIVGLFDGQKNFRVYLAHDSDEKAIEPRGANVSHSDGSSRWVIWQRMDSFFQSPGNTFYWPRTDPQLRRELREAAVAAR